MDIVRHTDDNLGGNYKLKVCFAEDVAEIPATFDGAIHHEVVMKAGTRWYDVYFTEGTLGFKDVQEDSEHGGAYTKEIVGFIPKDRPELVEALEIYKNRKCILDIIDNNGIRKLVGRVEEPLYFTSSSDSKTDVSGRAGTAISFKGQGIKKSPIYNV